MKPLLGTSFLFSQCRTTSAPGSPHRANDDFVGREGVVKMTRDPDGYYVTISALSMP